MSESQTELSLRVSLKKMFLAKAPTINLGRSDLGDNGKVSRPASAGLSVGSRQRHVHDEVANALRFAKAFFERVEKCLFELPSGSEKGQPLVFDKERGYCYPTPQQVKSYTKKEGDSAYINTSRRNVDAWIDKIVNIIKSNGYSRHETYRPHIEFITGKVGSGKSTFVRFVEEGYSSHLADKKILFFSIPHDQIAPDSAFASRPSNDPEKGRYDRILNVIYKNLACAFNRSTVIQDSIGGIEKIRAEFLEFCTKQKATFDEKDIFNVTNVHFALGEETAKSLPFLASFLAARGVRFLIVIDGLDTISFGKIVNQRYGQFFSDMAVCVFGVKHTKYTIPASNYIITLRNCTYERFIQSHSEHLRQISHNPLVPCAFSDLLKRGVTYFLKEDTGKAKFWEGRDTLIESFWTVLLRKFSLSLSIHANDDIAKYFEYNHREVMKGLAELARFAVAELYSTRSSEGVTIFDLLERVEELDVYDIFEAYLLNNKNGYFNAQTAGETVQKNINGGSLDNILNYHLNNKEDHDVPNFLLLKVRILQCLNYHSGYSGVEVIKKFMDTFGYGILQDDLLYTLDLLQSAGLIKIVHRAEKFEYSISNLGALLLKKVMFSVRYMENIVLDTLIPRIIIFRFGGRYKYSESTPEHRWIAQSLANLYLLLQIVREIEAIENTCFVRNRGGIFYPDLNWQIADTIALSANKLLDRIAKPMIVSVAAKNISETVNLFRDTASSAR